MLPACPSPQEPSCSPPRRGAGTQRAPTQAESPAQLSTLSAAPLWGVLAPSLPAWATRNQNCAHPREKYHALPLGAPSICTPGDRKTFRILPAKADGTPGQRTPHRLIDKARGFRGGVLLRGFYSLLRNVTASRPLSACGAREWSGRGVGGLHRFRPGTE